MNRIKEVRSAAGLSRKELGDAVGVTLHTIRRYEIGEIDVSLDMLQKIADVLECEPADLVVSGIGSGTPDIVAADAPVGMPRLGDLLGHKGLRLYAVLTEVVADAGVRRGDTIVVDETAAAIAARKAGDILVVRVPAPNILILRQYIPPRLLVTNRLGHDNSSLKLDDASTRLEVIGVVAGPSAVGGVE